MLKLKCEKCGTEYKAAKHYIPVLCEPCDKVEAERLKRVNKGQMFHQRSEQQKCREPW